MCLTHTSDISVLFEFRNLFFALIDILPVHSLSGMVSLCVLCSQGLWVAVCSFSILSISALTLTDKQEEQTAGMPVLIIDSCPTLEPSYTSYLRPYRLECQPWKIHVAGGSNTTSSEAQNVILFSNEKRWDQQGRIKAKLQKPSQISLGFWLFTPNATPLIVYGSIFTSTAHVLSWLGRFSLTQSIAGPPQPRIV